jgi:AbrB family looped-hinge helix DNA binding protein
METTRLSSKGQIILPKPVRDAHDWRPGTEFAVEEVAGGVMLRPLKPFQKSRFQDVYGCLRYSGRPKSVDEMTKAIADVVRKRRGRGRY